MCNWFISLFPSIVLDNLFGYSCIYLTGHFCAELYGIVRNYFRIVCNSAELHGIVRKLQVPQLSQKFLNFVKFWKWQKNNIKAANFKLLSYIVYKMKMLTDRATNYWNYIRFFFVTKFKTLWSLLNGNLLIFVFAFLHI